MTFGIIPESNRKGRAVCQFWLQGGKHNVTPTDKNYLQARVFLGRKETTKFPKEQPKKTSIENANLARRWRS